jgi:phosphoribosylamine---glycine ligase
MNSKKNILVIGGGGREHAFVKALRKSVNLNNLYILPGNGGTDVEAVTVDIKPNDFPNIGRFCRENSIDLVLVGPEQPLVDGITNFLENQGVKVFGPSKAAAQLEGSKDFMKEAVTKYGVPTASYKTFISASQAKTYVREKGTPIVIKTDGLAAGKGVTVAMTPEEASKAIDEAFAGKFGSAGKKVVIEEFLEGEEASFFVISDGRYVIEFGSAQDHKRAFDNDEGPNTGGMGTYSPAPIVTDFVRKKVMERIIAPTINGLLADGIPYKGFLFAGLMIDKNGNPKLIEYNIRMGDPETQVILPRLESDFVEVLFKAASGKLNEIREIKFSPQYALCVVMAAKGYPENHQKDFEVDLSATTTLTHSLAPTAIIYHAGTQKKGDKLISVGGRVLGITGKGNDLKQAYENAYACVEKVKSKALFYRKDIGFRELNRKR